MLWARRIKITLFNTTALKGYSCDYMPTFLWNIMSNDRYNKKPRPLNRKVDEKPVAILRCLSCEGGIIKNITLSDRQHRRRFLWTPQGPQTWQKLQESWTSVVYTFNGVHMRSFYAFEELAVGVSKSDWRMLGSRGLSQCVLTCQTQSRTPDEDVKQQLGTTELSDVLFNMLVAWLYLALSIIFCFVLFFSLGVELVCPV